MGSASSSRSADATSQISPDKSFSPSGSVSPSRRPQKPKGKVGHRFVSVVTPREAPLQLDTSHNTSLPGSDNDENDDVHPPRDGIATEQRPQPPAKRKARAVCVPLQRLVGAISGDGGGSSNFACAEHEPSSPFRVAMMSHSIEEPTTMAPHSKATATGSVWQFEDVSFTSSRNSASPVSILSNGGGSRGGSLMPTPSANATARALPPIARKVSAPLEVPGSGGVNGSAGFRLVDFRAFATSPDEEPADDGRDGGPRRSESPLLVAHAPNAVLTQQQQPTLLVPPSCLRRTSDETATSGDDCCGNGNRSQPPLSPTSPTCSHGAMVASTRRRTSGASGGRSPRRVSFAINGGIGMESIDRFDASMMGASLEGRHLFSPSATSSANSASSVAAAAGAGGAVFLHDDTARLPLVLLPAINSNGGGAIDGSSSGVAAGCATTTGNTTTNGNPHTDESFSTLLSSIPPIMLEPFFKSHSQSVAVPRPPPQQQQQQLQQRARDSISPTNAGGGCVGSNSSGNINYGRAFPGKELLLHGV